MTTNQIAYIEIPTTGFRQSLDFYTDIFGWSFRELGQDYAEFQNAGVTGGINPNANERTQSPLVLIETNQIEMMQERVRESGARITMQLFDYPGGRRFHFLDPSGNELGVFQNVP